ncbi:MAG TPA: VWA domain-containing protein [Chitinophagaceae bacterium]|nr:VWA domain-containing protein [Chitinophagaceae bacterium]
MKQHSVIFTLAVLGIISVLTLSSFFKPNHHPSNLANDDQSIFNSNSKSTQQRGNISLSTSFENDYYTRNHRQGHFYAELVSSKYSGNSEKYTPLNLSVVIDRSGSMAGDKIRNAKLAAKHIVDQMRPDDYLSIVIYDGTVDVLQSSITVNNKQLIKNKIDQITDRGGTNLMGGALEGYAQVKRHYQSNYINRVLLMSDGLANEGITDMKQIERIIRSKSRVDGISISTFGVGRDYNEDLMTAMAESGNGNYYFIDHAEHIASLFEKELHGLSQVIAQNAELKITLPEYVNVDKVYGHRFEQSGRVLSIQFHDIFSEETKGVLIKYTVQSGKNTTVNFNTSLSYYDATEERTKSINLVNKNEYTTNENLYNSHFSEWVATQVAIYESNETLELAMKEVDNGRYEEAKKIVKKNEVYMKSKPQSIQNAPSVQKATIINAEYDQKLDNVESMASDEIKYMQKDTKNSNYKVRAKK